MSSFQNPVGGGPRDPFENPYRIEPLDPDKLRQEGSPQPQEEISLKEKISFAAFLLQTFREVVDLFAFPHAEVPSSAVRENLLALKTALEILKKEDRSQDTQFLNHLSRIWKTALSDALCFRKSHTATLFKKLIYQIQRYPENTSYTFGYYLAEHADEKWIPFPYMDLIAEIHAEHTKNPTSSALTKWSSCIDELILLLQPD